MAKKQPEQVILENAHRIASDRKKAWPDRYEAYITLKARAYNKRRNGDPCWCSSSDKPEQDHSPCCNASRLAVLTIEELIREDREARKAQAPQ